jgi:hypothetical protein
MQLGDHLGPYLAILQRAYPHGVPSGDYPALLVVLQDLMSEENLAAVVAELIDGERVVVANDAAAAVSVYRPNHGDIKRVREFLGQNGMIFDD